MTDLITETQATVSDLNDCVFCALYEHKEPNLLSMVLRYGPVYTWRQIQSWNVG